jgi:TonB family protein
MVEAADLSERPQPPALNGVLRQHFPEEARRKGISGTAVVIARIDPDGTARSVRVASESSAGFGAACQATVMNSRWTPPRDRDHRPCATRVSYTCRFQVEQ